MPHLEKNIQTGWVWVCIRSEPSKRPSASAGKYDWHLQGIASTEYNAIAMCEDESYFIGPMPIDSALPTSMMQWPGVYFPFGRKPHQ